MSTSDGDGIPNELMRFVTQNSYSLLIKGAAGTGKTTLVLAILRALNLRDNFLFLCTRVSPLQLAQQYPWLTEFFKLTPKTESQSPSAMTNLSSFVDARLDEPTPLFERITNELMDTRSPTVVIDTWNSLEDFMEKGALMTNARVLQTWRERARARLILVGEDPLDERFDFLADGVAILRQDYLVGRRIREITFTKLRGVKIDRPCYFFTLNNATFQSFRHYQPEDLDVQDSVPQSPSAGGGSPILEGNRISTGHRELDGALGGGFRGGSIVSIEVDSQVSSRVAMAFLGGLFANFAAGGNPIAFCPYEGLSRDSVAQFLKSSIPKEHGSMVKVFWSETPKPPNKMKKHSRTPRAESTLGDRFKSLQEYAVKAKKTHRDKTMLSVMGLDLIEDSLREPSEQSAEQLFEFLRQNFALTLVIAREPGKDIKERPAGISETRLKIKSLNGTLFLEPQVPCSHLFAICTGNGLGNPLTKLEPMV